MKKNSLVYLVVIVLGIVAIYKAADAPKMDQATTAMQQTQYQGQAGLVGKPAQSFVLKGLDGRDYSVGGKRDKPLLLNFWASWCGPCMEEAPDLQEVYSRFSGQIDFYAVNLTHTDSLDSVKQFVKHYKWTFPVLLDQYGRVGQQFRIYAIPTSFLIDKDGNVQELLHVLPKDELAQKIQSVLQKES